MHIDFLHFDYVFSKVAEDRSLIHHIKTQFLETSSDTVINPNPELVYHPSTTPENNLDEVEVSSPETSSDNFANNVLREESNIAEEVDGEASQLLSWQLKDDAVSNGVNNSTSSSDCVSQTRENPEAAPRQLDGKKVLECNEQKSPGINGGDVHYHSVLSSLLKSSHQLILGPYRNGKRESSFVNWKERKSSPRLPQSSSPQWLMKKVLFEVAKMHENARVISVKHKEKCDDDHSEKQEAEEVDRNHVLSERKRREKISERFAILTSLVPSGGKVAFRLSPSSIISP